ncbi:MAG: MBL fold metallo-hydrolase [Archaeoglobaceae archaeon]
MTTIQFLGGCKEVGRSAVAVDSMMLDYGMKPSEPPEFPFNGVLPSHLIITHSHLDHVGVAPNLMDYDPMVYMTPPTKDLSGVLLKDSMNILENPPYSKKQFRQFESNTVDVGYDRPEYIDEWEVTFFNAGHIPGSATVHMSRDVDILYTGDIRLEETRLLNAANINFPQTDVLIVESTYYGIEHPPREKLEKAFVESVKETIENGGHAIIPVFAVGRTQEIVMILQKYGITPYVDGMGKDVGKLIENSPEYIKNPKKLKKALNRSIPVKKGKREDILSEPSPIVTTAGMLNGGPALFYISRLYNDPKSKILLTGYQVEGTNGESALNNGVMDLGMSTVNLKMGVEQYDFSAHADDKQLKELVKSVANKGAEVVFTVHGDDTEGFCGWVKEEVGIEAYSPYNGEIYVI